jgi:glycosyltransferase involved in cell wall biosynthesis
MRVLHVGFGYRPWIVNGLVIYCENLTEGQARAGHEVGYFFAGRQLPVVRRSFLHRWERRNVKMFEWVNSTLVVGRHRGTADPERDLADAPAETAMLRVLRRFAPELVHIHDLGGLPSSIIGIAQRHGVPVVMTLHDYQSLCPTVKLYDAEHRVCLRRRPGEMCVVCCAEAPLDNREDLERTVWYTRMRLRTAVPGLDAALSRMPAQGLLPRRRLPAGDPAAPVRPRATAAAYQHRRDLNVERLGQVDALITISERSAEICRQLGVSDERMRMLPINPSHIELLQPKLRRRPGAPLRFAVLNAGNSTQKGADLIVETLGHLSRRGLDGRYRLSVRGWIAPHVQTALAAHPSVDIEGDYRTDQLDALLEDVDVGLVPSVWEEVYGFVGLEFLAKGIPVIGNDLGGISEYVRPGETGWLNRSASAVELADLMTAAIEEPEEVQRLGAVAIELRADLIRPFATQLTELSALYGELTTQARRAS